MVWAGQFGLPRVRYFPAYNQLFGGALSGEMSSGWWFNDAFIFWFNRFDSL
jgi:hypothetical protein